MKKYTLHYSLFYRFLIGIGLASVVAVGCKPSVEMPSEIVAKNSKATVAKTDAPSETSTGDDVHGHEHQSGSHGGQILSLGRDSYHVEVVETKGSNPAERVVRLYLLGADESRIEEIEATSLQAFLKATGDSEAITEKVEPEAQSGDAVGKTSVLLLKIPEQLKDRKLSITIPNIRFGAERFRLAFDIGADEHEQDAIPGVSMSKDSAVEEKELYLTPGGLYTEADIKANGGVTASQKFRGVKATHDVKPKSGDLLCPISLTKANPEFTWIIGGKSYLFCCPPCVDEFLTLAKKSPEKILAPDTYVKP